jgi:hypothetical protein
MQKRSARGARPLRFQVGGNSTKLSGLTMNIGFCGLAAVIGLAALSSTGRAAAQPVSHEQMRDSTRGYYDAELRSAYAFVLFGSVTSVAGGALRTEGGDFGKGFGWASLLGGGLTALGGAAYGLTVVPRREYYVSLFEKDPARFEREEAAHIAGTNFRFVFYLGLEVATALAGAGVVAYGFVQDDDLLKGIGTSVALQGTGLFLLDLLGALRASSYADEVDRFEPKLHVSVGAKGQPWLASVSHAF